MGRKSRVIQIGAGVGVVLWAIALFLPMRSQAEMLSLGGIGDRLASAPAGAFANPQDPNSTVPVQEGWLAASGREFDPQEEECLARNVYFEAGGESFSGKVAVGAVTLNRVDDPRYPKTICGVVKQRSGVCQFSWMCSGARYRTPRGEAWEEARDVANILLNVDWFDPTDGALYFHAVYVRPSWSRVKPVSARIGKHIFYKDQWSSTDDESDASNDLHRVTALLEGRQ